MLIAETIEQYLIFQRIRWNILAQTNNTNLSVFHILQKKTPILRYRQVCARENIHRWWHSQINRWRVRLGLFDMILTNKHHTSWSSSSSLCYVIVTSLCMSKPLSLPFMCKVVMLKHWTFFNLKMGYIYQQKSSEYNASKRSNFI